MKKGDITSDGRVVLFISGPSAITVTPDEFVARGEKLPTKPEPVIRRGAIRDDGKVFFRYKKGYKNGEMWVSKERFDELVLSEKRPVSAAKKREYNQRQAIKRRLKAAGC